MFYKNTIETYTKFKSYDEFIEKITELGIKLHFNPPHITFDINYPITETKFRNFIISNLKNNISYNEFYKFNKEDSILEFFKIVDKYNNTNFSWNNQCNINDFKIHYLSKDFNSILTIPDGYSHFINRILQIKN